MNHITPHTTPQITPLRTARTRRLAAFATAAVVASGASLFGSNSAGAADAYGVVNASSPETATIVLNGDAIVWQGEVLTTRTTAGFTAFPTSGVASASPIGTVNPVKTPTIYSGNLAWIDTVTNGLKTVNPGGTVTSWAGAFPAAVDQMLGVGAQVWVARTGAVDRYSPTSTGIGSPTQVLPGVTAASTFRMALGPDGNVWIVEKNPTGVDTIGRYNATTGAVVGGGFNFGQNNADPSGITAGPDNSMWVILSGTNAIARFDSANFADATTTQATLPTGASPQSIISAPDGGVWITENATNTLARYSWSAGTFTRTQFLAPPSFGLKGLVAGADNNIWAVGTVANKIAKFGTIAPTTTTTTTIGATTTTVVAATTTTTTTLAPATTTTTAAPVTTLATVPPTTSVPVTTPTSKFRKVCTKTATKRTRIGKKVVISKVCVRSKLVRIS